MVRGKLIVAANAVLLAAACTLQAQTGGQEIKGQVQVKVGNHPVKLEENKLYEVILKAPKELALDLSVPAVGALFVRDKNYRVEKAYFIANRTGEQIINVRPSITMTSFTADYILTVNSHSLDGKPMLEEQGKWTDQDPTYKPQRDSHYKDYKIKLKAGQLCVIDLIKGPGNIDPYLYLEGPDGKEVAHDDDSGGNLNARIIYAASQDGEYRIIATTLFKVTGEFTLKVREAK